MQKTQTKRKKTIGQQEKKIPSHLSDLVVLSELICVN